MTRPAGYWSCAAGNLNTARPTFTRRRCCPTARYWWQGGRYRVAPVGPALNTAELWDPASGIWTLTGNLTTARDSHTATLLPNGNVLVVGGFDSGTFLAGAELCDSASGMWSATGNLTTARTDHTATLLPNGYLLVTGLMAVLLAARNCTTRPAGRGVPRAISSPHVERIRRRCCLTARYWWWQEELVPPAFLPARKRMTRSAGCGVPRATLPPHVELTRRRYCLTARCL